MNHLEVKLILYLSVIKIMKKNKTIILMFIFMNLNTSIFSAQSWQETLESNFDIAETFDELQDWSPPYDRGTVEDQNMMPKKIDGSPSIWNAYSYWSLVASPSAWIRDHGSDNIWRGAGKSLILDMCQDASFAYLGPSRLKTYFGGPSPDSVSPYTNSGIEESGYRGDVYIFEMIKLPTNLFPQQEIPNSYGTYNKYYSYFKFHVLATGKTNVADCTEGRPDCEYGASNIHTMFTVSDSGYQHFKLGYFCDADWPDLNLPIDGFQKWSPTNSESFLDSRLGNWFGLELHVHRGDPGATNGYQEYWLYDEDGNAAYVGRVPADYMMMTASHDWGFNYFFQGGNISFQNDVAAQGLNTTYFVDDIIINSSRIGPSYFALLPNSLDTTPPQTPGGITVK